MPIDHKEVVKILKTKQNKSSSKASSIAIEKEGCSAVSRPGEVDLIVREAELSQNEEGPVMDIDCHIIPAAAIDDLNDNVDVEESELVLSLTDSDIIDPLVLSDRSPVKSKNVQSTIIFDKNEDRDCSSNSLIPNLEQNDNSKFTAINEKLDFLMEKLSFKAEEDSETNHSDFF